MIKTTHRIIIVCIAAIIVGSATLPTASCEDKQAGAAASINMDAIYKAKENYFDYFMNYLNDQPLEDITFDGGYVNSNTLNIYENTESNFQITPDATKNGFEISLKKQGVQFKSNKFRYKYGFVVMKGSVNAKISDIKFSMFLEASTQTLDDGKIVPAFKVSDASVSISVSKMDVSIKGNSIASVVNVLMPVLKSTLQSELTSQMEKALKKSLPKELNKLIADNWGETELAEGVDLDWSLSYAPVVSEETIEMGFAAIINDVNLEEADTELPFIPANDASSTSDFQMFLSTWFLSRALDSIQGQDKLTYYIPSNETKDLIGMELTTESLNTYLFGIEAAYEDFGDALPVDLEVTVSSINKLETHELDQGMDLMANISCKLWVDTNPDDSENKTLAAELMLQDIDLDFSARVGDNDNKFVYFNLLNVTFDKMEAVQVNFETIFDFDELATFITAALKLALPAIERNLGEKKVAIPETLFGMFSLSDLTLKFADGYVECGFTPVLIQEGEISDEIIQLHSQKDTTTVITLEDRYGTLALEGESLEACEPCRGIVQGDYSNIDALMDLYEDLDGDTTKLTEATLKQICKACEPLFEAESQTTTLFMQ